MLGEASVRTLQHEQGLTSSQIAERIIPVMSQYRFNNSTLGWILNRTPGIIKQKASPTSIGVYFVEVGRIAHLPQQTEKRLLEHLTKYHPPTGDDRDVRNQK